MTPATVSDLAWYVSTGLIVLLMSIIAILLGWGFTLLAKKLDHLSDRLEHWAEKTLQLEGRVSVMEEKIKSVWRWMGDADES